MNAVIVPWPKWYRPARRVLAFELIDCCASAIGCAPDEIVGNGRGERLVAARAAITRVLRSQGVSYSSIGRVLKRDHTSIMHLHKTYPHKTRCPDIYETFLMLLQPMRFAA